MTKKEAVVAVILDPEGRALIGKRSLSKQSAPGYWVPISGCIEPGETELEALVREAFEEGGIKIRPLSKVGLIDTHDGRFRLHWWTAEIVDGVPTLMSDEFTELRWVDVQGLRQLSPCFPEDIQIIEASMQDHGYVR